MAPRFQLVIQFPQDFFESPDAMQTFEQRLESCLPRTCEYDGHDIGSGTINFFVYTNTPDAAHKTFRKYLGTRAVEQKLRIAYRESEGETFVNLWPRRDPRPFNYAYRAEDNPFARGAKRVIPKRSPAKTKANTTAAVKGSTPAKAKTKAEVKTKVSSKAKTKTAAP